MGDFDPATGGGSSSGRRGIEATLPSGVKLEAYLKVADLPDVSSKLAAKLAALSTAKQSDAVAKRGGPTKVPTPLLPESVFATLAKTLADVSAEAEAKIKAHITNHKMGGRGEAWISEGLGFANGNLCPFCAQDTGSGPLIEAYRQYFSEAYDGLVGEIDKLESEVGSALGEAAVAELGRVLAEDSASIDFWRQHVPIAVMNPDADALRDVLNAQRKVIEEAIGRKKARPLDAIAPSKELLEAVQAVSGIVQLLGEYNAQIDALAPVISSKRIAAGKANVPLLEGEIAALKLAQQRHEKKGKAFCDEYQNLVKQKAELDERKSKAKEKLDEHADQIISKYEKKINELLSGFGAGFSVVNTKKSYVGGTATSGYQLRISSHAIDLGDVGTPIGTPCFRTTLSAGDKSALALAFFLARLELDPNKSQKIVVFDDPFNSQDRSRRERTAELLKKYGGECRQLLVLSHDPLFLHLVYTRLPKADRHCLQLSRVPDNFTTIEEWDVEKETQDGYFRDHAALNSYLLNGATDLLATVRRIRPVLEGYMRYRFPNQFPPDRWLGDMIAHVRNEGPKHPMHPALAELEGINDYSKKFHHDSNPGKADSEILDDGELRLFAKRTLELAGGY